MFGKPVGNGKEVCTEFDLPEFPCEEFEPGLLWSGYSQVSGKQEAETIRGVMLDLEET